MRDTADIYSDNWYTYRECRHPECNIQTPQRFVSAVIEARANSAIVTFICLACDNLSAYEVPIDDYFKGKPYVCRLLWQKEFDGT